MDHSVSVGYFLFHLYSPENAVYSSWTCSQRLKHVRIKHHNPLSLYCCAMSSITRWGQDKKSNTGSNLKYLEL
jgi:hypothetical protein